MSLDATNEIDAVGIDKDTDIVVLSILDSWTWDNAQQHLQALQDKINAYFAFVESGEIYSVYPNAAMKSIRIEIIGRDQLPTAAISFLERASVVGTQLGLEIRHRVHQAPNGSTRG